MGAVTGRSRVSVLGQNALVRGRSWAELWHSRARAAARGATPAGAPWPRRFDRLSAGGSVALHVLAVLLQQTW